VKPEPVKPEPVKPEPVSENAGEVKERRETSGAINYFLDQKLSVGGNDISSRISRIKDTDLPADFELNGEDQNLLTRVQSKINSFHRLKDISGKSMRGESLSREDQAVLDNYSNDVKKVRADFEAFAKNNYRGKGDFAKAEEMLQPKVKEYIKTKFAPKVQPLLNLRNELALIDIPKSLSYSIMKPLNKERNDLRKKLPSASDVNSLRRILSDEKPSSGSLTYYIKVADQLEQAMSNDALREEVAEFNTKVEQAAKENNLETDAEKREKFASEIDNVLEEAETLPAPLGDGRNYEIFNNQKQHLIEYSGELRNSSIPDHELIGGSGSVDAIIFNDFKSKVSEFETAIPQDNKERKKMAVDELSKDIKKIFPKAEDVPSALKRLFDRNFEKTLQTRITKLSATPVQQIDSEKAEAIRQEIKSLRKDVKVAWNKSGEAISAVNNWHDAQRISKLPEDEIRKIAEAEIKTQGLSEKIETVIANYKELKSLLKKDKLSSDEAMQINNLMYRFVRFGSFEN